MASEPKIEWLEGSPTAKHTRRQNDVASRSATLPALHASKQRHGSWRSVVDSRSAMYDDDDRAVGEDVGGLDCRHRR